MNSPIAEKKQTQHLHPKNLLPLVVPSHLYKKDAVPRGYQEKRDEKGSNKGTVERSRGKNCKLGLIPRV